MKGIERNSQIISPKDIGYILLRLDIFPGKRVGEAGTGSGGLTLIMARAVGKDGGIYTFEKNPMLAGTIRQNLGRQKSLKRFSHERCHHAGHPSEARDGPVF